MKRTPLERWVAAKIGNGPDPLTRKRIASYQLLKLRKTVAWARAMSPFYRGHLAGKSESELFSLEDLNRFPFTDAQDIRGDPLRFLCVSQSEVNRVVTLHTSGTTGDPKRIYFTRDDQELTVDFFCIGMSTLVGFGDRVLILLPGDRPGSVGDLLVAGLHRLGAVGIAHGPVHDYQHTLEVMDRERINALVGVPVQVLALARHSQGEAAPRSVLLSTDHVPEAIKQELHAIWGCEVYTHYGMTEMGFGGGVECQARQGYHMREADLYVEIVDPETGESLRIGETGEVVFTTLTRRGMPLIRYRTGDLSRFISEPCPCGTVLKTMACVNGRLLDQVELAPGMVLTMAELDEALFPIEGLLDFSAAFTRRQGVNSLNIIANVPEEDRKGRTADICRALRSIPQLRAAIEGGTLAISATTQQGIFHPSSGSSKRTITIITN